MFGSLFFDIFSRYWPDCCFPIYLVTNKAGIDNSNVVCIKTGEEIDWFTRTIKAVESVQNDYIIFLLEDYFISKEVTNDEISSIV